MCRYNSWYDWMCNMNETQLMWSVDAMVSNGLVDLGYVYFVSGQLED